MPIYTPGVESNVVAIGTRSILGCNPSEARVTANEANHKFGWRLIE